MWFARMEGQKEVGCPVFLGPDSYSCVGVSRRSRASAGEQLGLGPIWSALKALMVSASLLKRRATIHSRVFSRQLRSEMGLHDLALSFFFFPVFGMTMHLAVFHEA